MMTVGERLKELREAAGLTLEEAGKIAGTTKQSASQIEKGVTKVPGGLFLYRWSKHYNVDLEWLITGVEPRRRSQSAGLDLPTLRVALRLLAADEKAAGAYSGANRARRLAAIYAQVAADGGRLAPAHRRDFRREINIRRAAGGEDGGVETVSGRRAAKR